MFAVLPQIYPKDLVDFFIRNDFRFLDDVFPNWLTQFTIQDFYKSVNELDPDFQFTFEELTTNINFLGISLKITNSILYFDVYTNLQIPLATQQTFQGFFNKVVWLI